MPKKITKKALNEANGRALTYQRMYDNLRKAYSVLGAANSRMGIELHDARAKIHQLEAKLAEQEKEHKLALAKTCHAAAQAFDRVLSETILQTQRDTIGEAFKYLADANRQG